MSFHEFYRAWNLVPIINPDNSIRNSSLIPRPIQQNAGNTMRCAILKMRNKIINMDESALLSANFSLSFLLFIERIDENNLPEHITNFPSYRIHSQLTNVIRPASHRNQIIPLF